MSLNRKSELRRVALATSRELRGRSTEAERILWEALRRRKLSGYKFYRQHPISYDIIGAGSFFVADFYCHEAKLVVELDGSVHDSRELADVDRTAILNALGLSVVRFKNEQVMTNLQAVLSELSAVCASRIPPFPSEGKVGQGDRVRITK
jgi:very-short-patch-repair endonuclease